MVRRVFFKLWLGCALILLVLAAVMETLLHVQSELLMASGRAGHVSSTAMWLVLLLAFCLMTGLCLRASRRFSLNEEGIVRFTERLAGGDFSARISGLETAGTP